MLGVLENHNLTNVCVVVTRYFGGIKLGAGGLIRAYAGSVALAVKEIGIVEIKEQAGIQIYPFDVKNLEGDKILIAGNAFRPDNNVEIAYADEHGLTYKRYHEFLGEFIA